MDLIYLDSDSKL